MPPDQMLLGARVLEITRRIGHRRCLLCGRRGSMHRILVAEDLSAQIVGGHRNDVHHFDPGERRLGLGPRR